MLNTIPAVRTDVIAPWGLLDVFEAVLPADSRAADSREVGLPVAAPQPLALRLVGPARFGITKWGKSFRREMFRLFFNPLRDDIGREWLTCPECTKEFLAHRIETGPNLPLRGCGHCGAVFFMAHAISQPSAGAANGVEVSHVC